MAGKSIKQTCKKYSSLANIYSVGLPYILNSTFFVTENEMVQIFIQRSNDLKEWVIIELQGELQSRYHNGLAGNVVGDLHINKDGDPILIIGHHILYGKVSKLSKPYGVMVKQKREFDETYYEITALIKKKISFKLRPKPIITFVPKSV